MKKKLLMLLLPFFLIACENEIGPLAIHFPTQLIVNGILNADGSAENRIYLHLSGREKVTNVADGVIKLYVNGQLKETITAEYNETYGEIYQYYYSVKSSFKPDDLVRIEVSAANDAYQVWAETKVTHPAAVMQIDTLSVTMKEDYEDTYYKDYLRMKFHLQEQTGASEQYFRMFAGYEFQMKGIHSETLKDTAYTFDNYSFIAREDMAMTDGRPQSPNNDYTGIFPQWQNRFNIFSNRYFTNGNYLMTVNIPLEYYEPYSPDIEITEMSVRIKYRFLGISKAEYNYLKTLDQYLEDYSESYIEPVKVSGNINGGLGLFAIEYNEIGYLD